MQYLLFSRYIIKILYNFKSYRLGFILRAIDAPLFLRIVYLLIPAFPRFYGVSKYRRLSMALEKMGVSYIKLGQMLSVRPDIVGIETAKSLATLQDSLQNVPWYIIKKIIDTNFGGQADAIFEYIDTTPISSASIAQVHKATLKELNQKVILKVVKPNVSNQIEKDFNFFMFVAKKLERIEKLKRLRLYDTVLFIRKKINLETNMEFEASALDNFASILQGNKKIIVPKVHWHLVSKEILVEDFIEGFSLSKNDFLNEKINKIDNNKLAITIVESFFEMVFNKRLFHADMHPGNIIVINDSLIALIDFGLTENLSAHTSIYFAKLINAFLKKDYTEASNIHFEAGWISNKESRYEFSLACRAICEPIFGLPQKEFSIAKLIIKLFEITEQFTMQTNLDLLLLQKTLVTIEGVARDIDKDINIWDICTNFFENNKNNIFKPEIRIKLLQEKKHQILNKIEIIKDKLNSTHSNFDKFLQRKPSGMINALLFVTTTLLSATLVLFFSLIL